MRDMMIDSRSAALVDVTIKNDDVVVAGIGSQNYVLGKDARGPTRDWRRLIGEHLKKEGNLHNKIIN